MRAVLKNLIDGLSEAWIKVGQYWRIPMFISDYSSQAEIGAKGNQPAVSLEACVQWLHLKQLEHLLAAYG